MDTTTFSAVTKLKKPLLRTTIGLFGISAALGILFIIAAPKGDAWKILATTTLLAFFSLFTMNNILRLDGAGMIKILAGLAMVSNVLWAVPWLIIIWGLSGWEFFESVWKMIWIFTNLSICLTLTGSFLHIKNTSNALDILRFTAIGSAWFLFVYISPAILVSGAGSYIGETWQLIAIVCILFAFSAISAPILNKIQSNKTQGDADYREQMKAEMRAQIEAEVRQEIAEQSADKTNTPSL